MNIEYFSVEGAPGQYFRCETYKITLSVSGCKDLYLAENERHCGRHQKCKGCPVGASHAGGGQPAPYLRGSRLCPRCLRGSARLVHGVCVSCVNRQYELARGVNARGTALSKTAALGAVNAAAVLHGGDVVAVQTEKAAGLYELILRALSRAPGAGRFCPLPRAAPGCGALKPFHTLKV